MSFEIENGVLKKYTEEEGVTEVVIPDGVTSIGERAFSHCSSLTSITIPDSVTSIGDSAFCSCGNLTTITIPDGVTSIGERAFCGCECLRSITIPDGVTSTGEKAFFLCSSLTSITIPESVTSIGKHAFFNCYNLTTVTIPDSVTSIGESAFLFCSNLTSITIPKSVTSIGDSAFYWCENLESFIFGNKECSITIRNDFVKSDGELKADAKTMFKFFNDKNDENFAEIKKADYKIPLALLWYAEDENETAKSYIKKNIKKIVIYLAKNKNVALIYKILLPEFITKKNVDAIVDSVIEATDNAEIRAVFLTYRHNNFGERDIFKELELL